MGTSVRQPRFDSPRHGGRARDRRPSRVRAGCARRSRRGSPTFHLSASFAPDVTASNAGVMRSAAASGIGFGVKGGPVFANFSSDIVNFDTKTGWAGGIFIGGSRAHTIGVMEEIDG